MCNTHKESKFNFSRTHIAAVNIHYENINQDKMKQHKKKISASSQKYEY